MILLEKENTDDPVRRTEMGKAMYVSFGGEVRVSNQQEGKIIKAVF